MLIKVGGKVTKVFSDSSKAFKDFKWHPKTKLQEGLFKSIS